MGALICFMMIICMPLKPQENFLVDSTAIPVRAEHNSRLDFTISTTNLHHSFHHHVLAPREAVRCGAQLHCCSCLGHPKIRGKTESNKATGRTELENELQVLSLCKQRQGKECNGISISDIQ